MEVEISVVELSYAFERIEVEDRHATALQLDEVTPPKLLQRAIHMHGGEPEALAEFDLGQREVEGIVLDKADDPQPRVQLA